MQAAGLTTALSAISFVPALGMSGVRGRRCTRRDGARRRRLPHRLD
jgi:hypothetical protein